MTEQSKKSLSASEIIKDAFPPHSYEQWKDAAIKLLKGASFEKKLLTKTHEGITLQPIYRKEDIEGIEHLNSMPGLGDLVRGGNVDGFVKDSWEVSQKLNVPTPEEFNAVAKDALMRGQTEIHFNVDHATALGLDPDQATEGQVGRCGLSLSTMKDFEVAFGGIDLSKVSFNIRAELAAPSLLAMMSAYCSKNGVDLTALRGSVAIDPLHVVAASGAASMSLDRMFDTMKELYSFGAETTPGVRTIGISTHAYHNGGASSTQELAYAMATAVEYFRKLDERGVSDIADLAKKMHFSLSVGGNFFMEIAKLRAFRVLWSKVLKAYGVEGVSSFLHSDTATWNKTKYDPNVNMLRCTTEAFAAVVGGANGIHVGPFDEILRPSDEFARRVARNVQLVLKEECDLTEVIDPAGGSWYIENLTDQVAKAAWEEFQKIEAAGGMLAALRDGLVQNDVEAIADEKIKALGKRKEVLVGTNMFPNFTEELLEIKEHDYKKIMIDRASKVETNRRPSNEVTMKLDDLTKTLSLKCGVEAIEYGASIGDVTKAVVGVENKLEMRAVKVRRWAEIFEELRDASKKYADQNGHAPRIFQANLGPSRFYRGRADWTSSFFQVGGFEMLADKDFDTVEDAVSAAVESKSKIIVLTSSDKKYEEEAENFAKALKSKDPSLHLILAGAPGENEGAWIGAGVDQFVNIRVNNYEMNKELLAKLGVM